MQSSISFRPLREADFPRLQRWLSAPHVAAWWRERLGIAAVRARSGPRVDGTEPTHVFVIEHEGHPFGWIQWYLWSDDPRHAVQIGAGPGSAGIDLAIGELAMTGWGLGTIAISDFIGQIVFADPTVNAVIADPEESNLKSLRAFEKAGFTRAHPVRLVGENLDRRVVRRDRSPL